MAIRLVPGSGFVNETTTALRLVPGVGFVKETASTGPQLRIITPSGGISLGGTSDTIRNATRAVSGGFVMGGTATRTSARSVTGAGGISLSGEGVALRLAVRTAVGGFILGGAADVQSGAGTQLRVITPTGGFSLGGAATVIKTSLQIAAGGFVLGGQALVEQSYGGAILVFGTLNDVIWKKLRILGKLGARNDMLNENTYWRALAGGSNRPLNQVKKEVLNGQGKTGAVPEMEKKYWEAL